MSAVKTIGIIGGGQLGLMIIEQAHLLGARTICLDPAEDAPAFKISDERIVGRFDDPAALEELCRRSDVVTYEFENVAAGPLGAIAPHARLHPPARALEVAQDRVNEKSFVEVLGGRPAPWERIGRAWYPPTSVPPAHSSQRLQPPISRHLRLSADICWRYCRQWPHESRAPP